MIRGGTYYMRPGRSPVRFFEGNQPMRRVEKSPEPISMNRFNHNAYSIHDPTHSPITNSAKPVQVVVMNEDQLAIRSPLTSALELCMFVEQSQEFRSAHFGYVL